MQFINKTSLLEKDFLNLQLEIPNTTSLLNLINSGKKKKAFVSEVIKLDEYTFDIIIPWQNNLVLVPDVT